MTAADFPVGDFPGTNTEPVIDGIKPVSQTTNLFGDENGEEY